MNFISFTVRREEAFLCPAGTPGRNHLKLIVMRINLIMVVIALACLHVTAGSMAQVSLHLKEASLEKVLTHIQAKTGYTVFYDISVLKTGKPVSIDVDAASIEQVLEQLFTMQPLLTYKVVGRTIVISEKKAATIEKPNHSAIMDTTVNLIGIVVNEKGEPLAGATIKLMGTDLSFTTRAKGEFRLIQPVQNLVLSVSFVGYEPVTVPLDYRQHTIRITLRQAQTKLDDVQIIGYGTTTRRTSTGSVSTVTAKEIETQPVTNPLEALEGRVPGLFITQASGSPGTGINVTLRAAAALASGTTPLFIVDGVSYVSDPLYLAGGNTSSFVRPAAGSSPLNAINPSDIESISVLKDADATAIYGSRGANGVILITTKKGKANQTVFNVNIDKGFSSVPDVHRIKPVSLAQYLEVRRQAYINSNITPTAANAPDLFTWSQDQSNDWQKQLFGQTAGVTNLTASVSGGSERTSFLISGTYHDEGQVTPGDFSYKRGGFHLNVSHQLPNRKFGIEATVTYNADRNNGALRPGANTDIANIAFQTPPNYPTYDAAGNLYWVNPANTFIVNPLSYTYRAYNGKTNNLVGNLTLNYKPVEDLTLRISSSYNRNMLYQQSLTYSAALNPNSGTKPSASFQENYTSAWNIEPQAEFSTNISRGRLSLLAGATLQNNAYVQPFAIVAQNFSSDYLLTNFTSAASYSAYSFESYYKYASTFGRVNYNWLNKYILNLNYRWDASSKFGKNNRSGSFYSVGGAWAFTEEKLLKDHLGWLSFGKIRTSYGRTGNDQISNYQYFDTYTTSFYTYDNTAGIYSANVANPDLKWEINKKLEAAIDLSFLKNRISLSATYFINRTNNPLVSYPLASLTGFTNYTANIPAIIQSKGPEIELTTENLKGNSFGWTTSFNISFPQNKLVKFDNIRNTGYTNTYIVGESLNSLYGYRYTGIDPKTSLPAFEDGNRDGISNYPQPQLSAYGLGDMFVVGKTSPAFFGGLNNTFKYKNLQLNVFIQFTGKRMIQGIGHASYNGQFPIGYNTTNFSSGAYDLYQQTNGKIATATANFVAGTPYIAYYMYTRSSAVFSNAAFARLKNVALSYAFPSEWIQKLHLKSGQVFARAQNLLTITDFAGYDPETPASNIPPLRTITLGLNCSF